MDDVSPPLSKSELHNRILGIVGTVAGLLVAVLLLDSRGGGIDGLGSALAGISIAFATVAYLAVSTILADLATDRRGVVLAHVASPFIMAALGALLFGR
jgi:hypothetical protein